MKYGEIIELGRHRLMCGDATKAEDVEVLIGGERVDLVLTDPPYGMKCQHKDGRIGSGGERNTPIGVAWRGGHWKRRQYTAQPTKYPLMAGDNSQDTARKHWEIVKDLTKRHIFWGGQYFAHFLPVSGAWIFWNKRTGNNDFSDGELAWTSIGKRVKMYTQLWNGVCMGGSYALNARTTKARIHPTQKPVELHVQILEDFSSEGDTILDCFGGSGTTLIACEVSNRRCLMMELSPGYCNVIRDRYTKLTKGKIPL